MFVPVFKLQYCLWIYPRGHFPFWHPIPGGCGCHNQKHSDQHQIKQEDETQERRQGGRTATHGSQHYFYGPHQGASGRRPRIARCEVSSTYPPIIDTTWGVVRYHGELVGGEPHPIRSKIVAQSASMRVVLLQLGSDSPARLARACACPCLCTACGHGSTACSCHTRRRPGLRT